MVYSAPPPRDPHTLWKSAVFTNALCGFGFLFFGKGWWWWWRGRRSMGTSEGTQCGAKITLGVIGTQSWRRHWTHQSHSNPALEIHGYLREIFNRSRSQGFSPVLFRYQEAGQLTSWLDKNIKDCNSKHHLLDTTAAPSEKGWGRYTQEDHMSRPMAWIKIGLSQFQQSCSPLSQMRVASRSSSS